MSDFDEMDEELRAMSGNERRRWNSENRCLNCKLIQRVCQCTKEQKIAARNEYQEWREEQEFIRSGAYD